MKGSTYFVTPIPRQCENSNYEVVFEGPVFKVTDELDNQVSISYLSTNTSNRIFYLTQRTPTTICYLPAFETQHPNLFVIERGNLNFNLKYDNGQVVARNINLDAHIGMKLSYLQYQLGAQMTELYRVLLKEICEVNAKATLNLLAHAKNDSKDLGYLYFNKPGYMGVVRGRLYI